VLFAVCRIGKVSSWGNVGAMQAHWSRSKETPNADPERTHLNQTLIGSDDISSDLRNRVGAIEQARSDAGARKIRKDAVLTVEHILTASPEYFRPGNPGAAGTWDEERLKPWVSANVEWLKERYGDRCVGAILHLDEQTPHIHAAIIPEGRDNQGVLTLSAKELVGNKSKLTKLQDDYATSMSHLGLERGKSKSETNADHTEIREYYSGMAEAEASAKASRNAAFDAHREMHSHLQSAAEERRKAKAERQAAEQERQAAAADRSAAASERTAVAEERQAVAAEKGQLRDAWSEVVKEREEASALKKAAEID